jgi:prepilin-type N-terminal cleavage/methylation domain-containing protein
MTQRRHSGFTLLEIMIAIGVILILMTLVLSASRRAFSSQDERAAKNLLTTLDRALSEYTTVSSSIPKYDPGTFEDVPSPNLFEEGDGVNQRGNSDAFRNYPPGAQDAVEHPYRPDASVFIRQTRGYGEVDSIINGIDSRFMQTTIIGSGTNAAADPTPSVVDLWAIDDAAWKTAGYAVAVQQIILYVHPENPLAQDLYGRCVNARPYFMSAGPDKKFGLRAEFRGRTADTGEQLKLAEKALADNIYSYKPGPHRKDMSER